MHNYSSPALLLLPFLLLVCAPLPASPAPVRSPVLTPLAPLRPGDALSAWMEVFMLGEVKKAFQEEKERRRRRTDDVADGEDAGDMLALASALRRAAALEPQQCVKRLVCDLATGRLGHREDALVAELNTVDSSSGPDPRPSTDFRGAIRNGRLFASVSRCEVRYRCPFTGRQLMVLAENM